ncbi:MAG: ankyrin repeat domain-containing protein, partial [Fusobacteriaceae bacterium]|nr:ankyrin repeat domain-containing protein [Fusobacteriaceae bacterium]
VNMQNNNGYTALMISKDYEISRLLVKNGANANIKNKYLNTALDIAENIQIIKLLLENGADINSRDESLETVIFTSNIEKIRLLSKFGADLEVKNNWGYTPLMWALMPDVTQALIDVGANIYAINDSGEDVLDVYTKEANDEYDTYGREEMLEMIKILKSYMVDYEVLSKIIADYSKEKNLEKTIKELEKSNVKTILKHKPKYFTDTQYILVLNDYAYFLSETERYKEAIPILERVILLSPDRALAYGNLSSCYKKLYKETGDKNYKIEQKKYFRKYIRLWIKLYLKI